MSTGEFVPSEKISKLPVWVFLLILLFFIFFSYSNSIYSPFVLDDGHTFLSNGKVYLNEFSLGSIRELGQGSVFGFNRLLPLVSFSVDHYIYSKTQSIAQYHLTNILIHLLTALAVFFLLKGIFRCRKATTFLTFFRPHHFILFICALWALNPVQTNAVTYIVQRMASLVALFYIASVASYLFGRTTATPFKRILYFSLSLVFAVCAFLSKENAYTLPIAIVLVEYLFLSPDFSIRSFFKSRWRLAVFVFVIGVVLFPLLETKFISSTAAYQTRHFTMVERLLTESRVILFYITLLIFPLPSRMNLDHDFQVSKSLFSPPSTFLAIVLIIFLVIIACLNRRKNPLLCFGIVWFFLNLVIESTIVPLELVFEHRAYLPSIGLFISLLYILDNLLAGAANKVGKKELYSFSVLALIIVSVAFSLLTTIRNHDWRDFLSINGDCAKKSPLKARTQSNYGLGLGYNGMHDQALEKFELALRLGKNKPFAKNYNEYAVAANNIIKTLAEQEKYDEALSRAKELIKNMPLQIDKDTFPKILSNLGFIYMKLEKYLLSYESLYNALLFEEGQKNLYLEQGLYKIMTLIYDDENLREDFNFLHDVDKESAIFLKLAELLLEVRDYESAIKYATLAHTMDSNNTKAQLFIEEIADIKKQNHEILLKSDIHHHKTYQEDIKYYIIMTIIEFIDKSYTPLRPTIGWLLQQLGEKYTNDPFYMSYYARHLLAQRQYQAAEKLLERGENLHPDFLPLLTHKVELVRTMNNRDKLKAVYSKIIDKHHGSPKWRLLQFMHRKTS